MDTLPFRQIVLCLLYTSGKVGTGILWLLTLGILGIGALVDFIMIIVGSFKDKDGKVLAEW